MKDLCRRFFYEETAVGVVEMILILVVLIGLVIIFKQQLTSKVILYDEERRYDGLF